MKVMHVLRSSNYSGAENVACQIISLFKEDNDYEMIYVSRDGPIKNTVEKKGISFYGLNRLNIIEIRKAIKYFNPTVIHSHDIVAGIVAVIATIGTNIKVISHVHVNNSNMSNVNIKTILYCLFSFKFLHIFWVSQSSLECYKFRKVVMRKSSVLCNVVNKNQIIERKNLDLNEYNYDIIFIGRLTSQKNPTRLVSILAKLKLRVPNVKIAIIGTGDLENITKKLCTENGLNSNITFYGFQENPMKILEQSKLLLMTSNYEGLPMCVLEALALGVPVVSTPVDGLLNIILNDYNGFLESKEDELVVKSYEIITNRLLRKKMSINAIKSFDNINDIDKYKCEIEKIYKEV